MHEPYPFLHFPPLDSFTFDMHVSPASAPTQLMQHAILGPPVDLNAPHSADVKISKRLRYRLFGDRKKVAWIQGADIGRKAQHLVRI